MDLNLLQEYLVSKKFTTEEIPFGEDTLVYKVGGKIFALMGIEHLPPRLNLKNTPAKVSSLREDYSEITDGYHMNKKHWVTIHLENHLNQDFIEELIDESYSLVWDGLSKKIRIELENERDDA